MQALSRLPENADVIMKFKDEAALREMLMSTPNEVLNMMMKNKLVTEGNLNWLQVFNFYLSLMLGKIHQRRLDHIQKRAEASRENQYAQRDQQAVNEFTKRKNQRLRGEPVDAGVLGLKDPYLSDYTLEDFPRLKADLDRHLNIKPEICPERPLVLTRWHRENGFENKTDGTPWSPQLRQGAAFKYLMENKKPRVGEGALLGGQYYRRRPNWCCDLSGRSGGYVMGRIAHSRKSCSESLSHFSGNHGPNAS